MSVHGQISASRSSLNLQISTAALALAFVATIMAGVPAAQAQTFSALYNFKGQADGGTPEGVLSVDKAGNLYGTASTGGNGGCEPMARLRV